MKYLLFILMPALFVPDVLYSFNSPYGQIKAADLAIVPYFFLSYFLANKKNIFLLDTSYPFMKAFLCWIVIVTVTMPLRYDYGQIFDINFVTSLGKVGKFYLYAAAALFTIRSLDNENDRLLFYWSLLGCTLIPSLTIIVLGSPKQTVIDKVYAESYQSGNLVSALLAIQIAYLAGLIANRCVSLLWIRAAVLTTILAVTANLLTKGRGGMLGALVALGYLSAFSTAKKRIFVFVGLLAVLAFGLYHYDERIQGMINMTLHPSLYIERENQSKSLDLIGIDDGARLEVWVQSIGSFLEAPVLGSGFYHRLGLTTVEASHNFFIQMLLETGLLGLVLVIIILYQFWEPRKNIPLNQQGDVLKAKRAALIAACVCGMSGEYFYGNPSLFFLLVIGASRAIPITDEKLSSVYRSSRRQSAAIHGVGANW